MDRNGQQQGTNITKQPYNKVTSENKKTMTKTGGLLEKKRKNG